MSEYDFDIIIVGAGLSGIGAAYHFKKNCPNKRVLILEGRERLGGTWDLFRYPGIRSDSDMYTLGYNFKPWTNAKAIADGPDILNYIQETASENDIEKLIQYNRKVTSVEWTSEDSTWTMKVDDVKTGDALSYRCNYMLSCTGYYNYEAGYEPEFEGREDFKGNVIHPQKWPDNLDYEGKNVVVIGSGATAVTLVPAMAEKTKKITMLQRSPSYVMSLPLEDAMSNTLRKYVPEKLVYRMARTRNISLSLMMYRFCKAYPKQARKVVLSQVRRQLGKDYDLKHFSPSYYPWDERLCAVPNGDMFKAIRKGKAEVVTEHIEKFTEKGISLKSGEELEADIIITATGLDVQLFGGVSVTVDGQPFNVNDKMCYRGVLIEDLPNLGMVFGYTNASWTLKADLVTEYVCRIINHMDDTGQSKCVPKNLDNEVEHLPFIDMQSGYIDRASGQMPNQGSKMPWKLYQNYALDLMTLRFGKVKDSILKFS